ncbi:MAG: DNA-protecting protein DprA [Gammaproteobacteria bacterium]|nr:DNA-protecting protein DprA [Gammaproteobacteria bacterium]
MNRDEFAYYLRLSLCPGIGPVKFRKLLEAENFDVSRLFHCSSKQLSARGLNDKQISAINNSRQDEVNQALNWQQSNPSHHLVTLNDPYYPTLLKEIKDAPPILYGLGNIELLSNPQIAMIGSRNCTPGGASTAHDFASFLAKSGITITSGMALGIDKHSHQGALDAGGNTIAVIGTGIDRIYPSKNKKLAHQIAENGLIISEFPLGTSPHSENFPKRNRLISGLSLATLVVEATRKSGSLITAHNSIEQGRDVFAIPGSIHNPQSKGCHHLIRQGAKLVDQASDIIEDIGSLLGFVALQNETEKKPGSDQLDAEYQQLLDNIGYDPVSIETLVQRCGLTIEQLSSMLLILELNDHIQTAPGSQYIRC